MQQWPVGRSRHGGVDEIPLPEGPGRLWLCGKRFIGPDPVAAQAECNADRVVCLCERPELDERYPQYVEWLDAHQGREAYWFPIPDLHVPAAEDVVPFLDDLQRLIHSGHSILMHCGAGFGRAGTLAAALLIRMGATRHDALAVVARSRPMAGPEAGAQAALLYQLAGDEPEEPDAGLMQWHAG